MGNLKYPDPRARSMKGYFPFPNIRKGQDAFYNETKETLGKEGILFAHAPTGIGKTAAVLAAALEVAIPEGKKVFFMTPKQSQHRIAIETLRQIKERHNIPLVVSDVISKQAMCPRDIAKEYHVVFNMLCALQIKTHQCPYYRTEENLLNYLSSTIHHVEELKELASKEGMCPHRAAIELASGAHVLVCDYNYIFSDISEIMLQRIGIDLKDIIIIVDEAHNLSERIRDHLSGNLTLYQLREGARTLQSRDKVLYTHLIRIGDYLNEELKDLKEGEERAVEKAFFIKGINRTLSETLDEKISLGEFLDRLRSLGEIELQQKHSHTLIGIVEFILGWLSSSATVRLLTRKETPALRYQLLDPSVMSLPILKKVHSAVFMSGTLYPTSMYADVLGAMGTGKPVLCREYCSPFPPENRRIVVSTSVNTRYIERGEPMYRSISKQISDVANAVYENTAVFFPSYHLLEQVWGLFPINPMWRIYKEQRGMSKEQRTELFAQMTRHHGNYRAMLWGVQAGSLSEGMDYSGNALKTIIVVGLPLVPPSLFVEQLIGYYSRKFGRDRGRMYAYVYPAVNKVLQAAGRGIRSEKDVGIIVLMDNRFEKPMYKGCFPPEYEILYADDPADVCRGFFAGLRQKGGRGK
ncbi:MAG: ATP-dependent DNA helicase [Thermoplasmata archaeon]|nr:ATP-dependent DNA helicase [Thermoplasmata archaeon]